MQVVDELFAAKFAQAVGGLADAVVGVGGAGEGVHLGGEVADGEAVRAGATASPADSASRIRFLFRSTPPTRVAPSVDPLGSSSRMPSARNPVSTQSRAVANRSAIPASWVTISGNFSIMRPQRNSAVLCAIASNRSTRSPYMCWGPP